MLAERGRRTSSEGDVQEDVPRGRPAPSTTGLMDDPADLLVARPGQAKRVGDEPDPSVRLRDPHGRVVEALDRGDETDVGSGS